MCSRYYIDPNMMEEISRVVQNIDGRIRLTQGDIRPTDVAPVIGQSEHGLELGICRWGYPRQKAKIRSSMQGWKLSWINLLFRTESYITGC